MANQYIQNTPVPLQTAMADHWAGLSTRISAHVAGNVGAAAAFSRLRRDFAEENWLVVGPAMRPTFLSTYSAAAAVGGQKPPSTGFLYKLWAAADAYDAGITVDPEAPDAWESFCAAGKRLSAHMVAGKTADEAKNAVQDEINEGSVRTRAARKTDDGLVAVDLPIVARPTEEKLHARVRSVAESHHIPIPGGAPEIRALLTEGLNALPDAVLPAVLTGWSGWTVISDDALSDLMAKAGQP